MNFYVSVSKLSLNLEIINCYKMDDYVLISLCLKNTSLPSELVNLIQRYYYTLCSGPMMILIECEIYYYCKQFRNILYGNEYKENTIPNPIKEHWPNIRFTHIVRKSITPDTNYNAQLRPFVNSPMLPMILIIPGIIWDIFLINNVDFVEGTQLIYDFCESEDFSISDLLHIIDNMLKNTDFILASNKLIL